MIEIVCVLVTAGDGKHARAQDVGDAVRDEQRVTRIGDERCEPSRNPHAPFGGCQQHDAAI